MSILDRKDARLLFTMDFHSRMSLSQLGRQLGMSKQTIKYRLEKLEKRNIIQGYYADINASKLGMSIYLVYLEFSKISPEQEIKFSEHLSQQEAVGVNASIQGRWNYCFGIWASSITHFKQTYETIMESYEQFVKSKTIMIETDFYYFKPKPLLEEKNEEEIIMTGSIQTHKLDMIDSKILQALAKNARISLINIAQVVDLTASAVKTRIRHLERQKIILGYRVMINYALLGFLHYRVFLHLENSTKKQIAQLITYLKTKKEVISITKTIGYCDLEFRAVVRDIQEFFSLITALRNTFTIIKAHDEIIYYGFFDSLNYFPFINSHIN